MGIAAERFNLLVIFFPVIIDRHKGIQLSHHLAKFSIHEAVDPVLFLLMHEIKRRIKIFEIFEVPWHEVFILFIRRQFAFILVKCHGASLILPDARSAAFEKDHPS